MRRPKRPAHRMIDKRRPRRPGFFHDVECRANHERGNAAGFNDVGDETDGLVAKRSIGDEQRQIHCGRLKFSCYGGRQIALYFAVAPQASHKGNVERRDAGDKTLFGKRS